METTAAQHQALAERVIHENNVRAAKEQLAVAQKRLAEAEQALKKHIKESSN